MIAFLNVGRTGFEPATPWSQTKYSTELNYLPKVEVLFTLLIFERFFLCDSPDVSIRIFYRAELPPVIHKSCKCKLYFYNS